MSQTRFFDFNETVKSATLSTILRDLLLPGIYRGFDASVLVGGALNISAGALLLPNGVYVAEDRDQQFIIEPSSSDVNKINYLILCRHRIKNIVGGQQAEFVVVREENLATSLDSSDDPTSPWSYVVVAYVNSVGTTGVRDAVISTPRRIRNILQSVVETIVVGQNSYERLFSVPFADGVAVKTEIGRYPIPTISGKSTPIAISAVSMDTVTHLVTVATVPRHGLLNGQFVSVTGVGEPAYSGTYGPISVIGPYQFTFEKVPPVGGLPPSIGGIAIPVFSEMSSISGRELRFYPALFANLEFEAFVPNGLIPNEVLIVARSGAQTGSLSGITPSVTLSVLDATGHPVMLQEGNGTERLIFISSSDFVNHGTTLNASFATFPTYGHFIVKLAINNVDLAGVIVSYRGVNASVIKASELSDSGIITEVIISP